MSGDAGMEGVRHRTFLRLWAIGAFGSTGRWLDTLVYALLVVEVGGGALDVTTLMLVRTLPLALFGWLVGRLAEHVAPRTALTAGAGIAAAVAIAVAALAFAGTPTVFALSCAAFAGGLVWAADLPVRRVLIGEVVGPEHTGRAMSLDTVAGSATRAVGPLLGGLLYAHAGAPGALAASAVLHLVAMCLALGVSVPGGTGQSEGTMRGTARPATHAKSGAGRRENALQPLAAPLAVIRGSILAPVFVLTVLFNLFAYPIISLLPLLGATLYELTPAQVGLLVSVEGMASAVAALLLVVAVRPAAARQVFTCAAVIYVLGGLILANVQSALPAALAVAVMGSALAAFAAMQSALVLANAPAGQARRMMGVLSICIGTGPLGYLALGALAEVVGTTRACAISAAIALVALVLIALRWPGLMARQPAAPTTEARMA